MPVPPTGGRLQWTDVPAPLRARLEDALDAPVTDAVTPNGGFGHQLAAALRLAGGRRVFVKVAPDDDPLTVANVHEAAVLGALPPGAPAPELPGIHRRPTGPQLSSLTWTDRILACPCSPAMPGRPGRCRTSSPPARPRRRTSRQ
ncbi:hypothetical protein ACFZDP_31040 [Streptomyces mirabilis]|uniref:hypothetical protein n=1 Tax=Streptomyces mirabilis TaxID=68239 RepID=UPI0006CE0669|nr:hypothetical protein OK006_6515 [Actinobacteria bacterium OK006]